MVLILKIYSVTVSNEGLKTHVSAFYGLFTFFGRSLIFKEISLKFSKSSSILLKKVLFPLKQILLKKYK